MPQSDLAKAPDFDKLMSEMEVAIAGAMSDLLHDHRRVNGDKHQLIATYTYCGKDRGAQLRSCTRCK